MSHSKELRELEKSIHPILLQKWKQIFRFFDVNDDNLWNHQDLEVIKERLMNHPNMSQEKRDECTEMVHKMWTENLGGDVNGSMTYEQWLPRIKSFYESGQLEDAMRMLRTNIFHCIDLDDDGKINNKEFKIFYTASGKSELQYMDRAFQAIDTNNDGIISLAEYVDAHVKYFCDMTVKVEDLPVFGLSKASRERCGVC